MATKKKQPAASETSESIEKQMQEFLARGGQIEKVESGVSGQAQQTGPRHISLGNSRTRPQS